MALYATSAWGQTRSGSTGGALLGAGLGAASGAMLGFTAGIIPCTEHSVGVGCVRAYTAAGGAIGLLGGALLGANDTERLGDLALSAGIGFGVGTAAGLLIKPLAQRFGWLDVATVGLLGGAVGAVPVGAALGFGVGGGVGLLLWRAGPRLPFPRALGLAVTGLALGGLTQWVVEGAGAPRSSGVVLTVPLQIRF